MKTRPTHGGNLVWATHVADCSLRELLDFSASINPLGPPPCAIAALQNSTAALRHSPDPNYTALRGAIARHHDIDPDWILPGNGAAELLTWAAWDLAAHTETTALIAPAFADYRRALRAFQIAVQDVPLALDPAHPQTPVFPDNLSGILLNNPHNPTGTIWPLATVVPWIARSRLAIVDEAFMDFLPPSQQESLIDQVAQWPQVVILRSLTKFYSLPGLRLGYAIAHPDRIRIWQDRRDPWAVNGLAAAVGVEILQDHDFQQQTWAWLPPARQALAAGLAQIPGLEPQPGAANFLLVRTEIPSDRLQIHLLKTAKILIRDCLSFPELGDRYFRVAVRTPADNQRLLTALQTSVTALSSPAP